jgi:hypothetical protein
MSDVIEGKFTEISEYKRKLKPPIAIPDSVEEIWKQLPGEAAKPYRAFYIYKNLGVERTHAKVAAALYPNLRRPDGKMRYIYGGIAKWSTQYRWKERAAAWDEYCFKEQEREWLDRQRTLRAKQWSASEDLFQKGLDGLKNIDAETLAPRDIARFLELASQLGMTTRESPVTSDQVKIFLDSFPAPLREKVVALLKQPGT